MSVGLGELIIILVLGAVVCAGPISMLIMFVVFGRAPCPHCRARIPRTARSCPRCSRALREGWTR